MFRNIIALHRHRRTMAAVNYLPQAENYRFIGIFRDDSHPTCVRRDLWMCFAYQQIHPLGNYIVPINFRQDEFEAGASLNFSNGRPIERGAGDVGNINNIPPDLMRHAQIDFQVALEFISHSENFLKLPELSKLPQLTEAFFKQAANSSGQPHIPVYWQSAGSQLIQ